MPSILILYYNIIIDNYRNISVQVITVFTILSNYYYTKLMFISWSTCTSMIVSSSSPQKHAQHIIISIFVPEQVH